MSKTPAPPRGPARRPRSSPSPATEDPAIDPAKDALLMAAATEAIHNFVSELPAGRFTEKKLAGRARRAPAPSALLALPREDVLKLAYDEGVKAGEAIPEGQACGRGDVMSPGALDYVNDPLVRSPFGQDYDRHVAFTGAAVRVLLQHGIPAVSRVSLD